MAKKKDKNIDQFKQGIFSLRTNFGELAQLMVKKDMGLHAADNGSYDLKDDNGHRIEVKFSRAYKKVSLTEDNAIDICTNSTSTVYASSEAEDKAANYDCNIEQLKPRCFDSLYYGVFFADRIAIFKMNSNEIMSCLGYSDKQHKGNEGEGQFHLNRSTIDYHMKNHFVQWLTYEELYDMLSAL